MAEIFAKGTISFSTIHSLSEHDQETEEKDVSRVTETANIYRKHTRAIKMWEVLIEIKISDHPGGSVERGTMTCALGRSIEADRITTNHSSHSNSRE